MNNLNRHILSVWASRGPGLYSLPAGLYSISENTPETLFSTMRPGASLVRVVVESIVAGFPLASQV